ncbi:MAG: hypothetical protein KDJ36_07075 [Hyphomicrobiaceae bacterium]|nr:hypothetical protein [Hyphomicrobiaceae bacterium]
MNDIDARGRETYRGYIAEYRLPRHGRWVPVAVRGVTQLFGSEFEAECRAWRELKRLCFGAVRSSGHPPLKGRSEAERLFGTIFVKGRQVPVERV